jgi:hypothetical protein
MLSRSRNTTAVLVCLMSSRTYLRKLLQKHYARMSFGVLVGKADDCIVAR